MHIPVAPRRLILAQTCTFSECFGLGLGRGASPCILKQNLLCIFICMVHSSVYITSSKVSFWCALAHSYLFNLLGSRINWQYALPRNVHPRMDLHRSTVLLDKLNPFFSTIPCIWWAVVSSSRLICCSTNTLICSQIFVVLPEPNFFISPNAPEIDEPQLCYIPAPPPLRNDKWMVPCIQH